jgi:putative MATE family efflux protein
MFDGIQVSSIGNNANSAVTITKQPIFLMISFIVAINIALTAIVSRRYGENNREAVNKTMYQGIKISFIVAVILSVIVCVFAKSFCKLMGATANTIDYATTYLTIISAGFVFNALRLTINACQRGIGKTKISMYTNLVANIVNVCLNFVLINGHLGMPKMGIAGAAVATVIGNAVAFIISFITILSPKGYLKLNMKEFMKFDTETLRNIGQILPSTLMDQLLIRFGFIIFALIVNYLGDDATYVHGVCQDINSLMFTLADGFSIGTAAIVGHRLGEKRKDLALVYAKVSMIISFACAILVSIFVVCCRGFLVGLYKPETLDRENSAKLILLIASIMMLPQNTSWVMTGILRGSGDTKFTALVSLICIVFVRPISAVVLCYPLGLGVIGAWIGMIFDQVVRLVMNTHRFRQKKWLQIKV